MLSAYDKSHRGFEFDFFVFGGGGVGERLYTKKKIRPSRITAVEKTRMFFSGENVISKSIPNYIRIIIEGMTTDRFQGIFVHTITIKVLFRVCACVTYTCVVNVH